MRTYVTTKLNTVITWLEFQPEDLSFGLRSAEDAVKLYNYGLDNPDLPVFVYRWGEQDRIDALGYDPLA